VVVRAPPVDHFAGWHYVMASPSFPSALTCARMARRRLFFFCSRICRGLISKEFGPIDVCRCQRRHHSHADAAPALQEGGCGGSGRYGRSNRDSRGSSDSAGLAHRILHGFHIRKFAALSRLNRGEQLQALLETLGVSRAVLGQAAAHLDCLLDSGKRARVIPCLV